MKFGVMLDLTVMLWVLVKMISEKKVGKSTEAAAKAKLLLHVS